MTDWVAKQMPEPDKLYHHLRNAFNKLEGNVDYIPGADSRVEQSVDKACRQLSNGNESDWTLKSDPYLIFNLNSERDFANGNGQARLGGNINVSDGHYEMFSCSLILAVQHPSENDDLPKGLDHCCIETGKDEIENSFFHILDRVHWDIDTGDDDDERKPVCHFQVGGEVSDNAFNESFEKYHYCSNGLDKPRIPHPPMDPILVFNMLINQYHSLESFNQSQWAGIVDKGEAALWERYYDSTQGMVSTDSGTVMDLMQPTK